MSADSLVLQVHERGWVRSFAIIPHYHREKTHSLVEQSVKFGDALDSSAKRTVFMFVIMHFHDHSMQKFLFLGVRECILIKLLIEATIPLRVVYVIFGSLASLKLFRLLLQAFCLRFFKSIHITH